MRKILCIPLALTLLSCATPALEKETATRRNELSAEIRQRLETPTPGAVRSRPDDSAAPPASRRKEAAFQPARPDVSPLATRIVSISARNEPLRNVLKIIADAAYLNLVIEHGVDAERPVTLNLQEVTAGSALETVVEAAGYFYTVRRNVLSVRARETLVFEFGHPAVVNDYVLQLGGDMLGGGDEQTSNIRGDVSLKADVDKKARNLWDAVDAALASMLGVTDGGEADADAPSYSINRASGIIVVTADRERLERVKAFLGKIRASLNRQVMIEARILEVQLSDDLRYGIDWSFIEDLDGVGEISLGTFAPAAPASNGFADLFDATESFFGFGVSGASFSSLLQALQSQGQVSVLSNPRVRLLNGQTALLSVGQNVTYVSKVETTTTSTETIGTVSFTVETSSVLSGLMIGLAPFIDADGTVSMTVTPIISELQSLEDKAFGQNGEVTVTLPTIDLREMSTTVKARSGELVVIGGLINRLETEEESGIPILSDLPLLGPLFRNKRIRTDRNELVLLLKPTVYGIP